MSVPSFFWEVGLHGAGYDAEGVTVPAGAGLVIGRTAAPSTTSKRRSTACTPTRPAT